MLASLYNVFKDQIGLSQFSFANNDEHVRINSAVLGQFNIRLPSYVLDPIAVADPANWLYMHQDIHNQTNSVLGIAGNDISDVDFNNPGQLSSWIWLHAQEHYQAAQILGIG